MKILIYPVFVFIVTLRAGAADFIWSCQADYSKTRISKSKPTEPRAGITSSQNCYTRGLDKIKRLGCRITDKNLNNYSFACKSGIGLLQGVGWVCRVNTENCAAPNMLVMNARLKTSCEKAYNPIQTLDLYEIESSKDKICFTDMDKLNKTLYETKEFKKTNPPAAN